MDRLVEAVACDEVRADLRGRPLAERRHARIARDDAREDEDEEDDAEQHRDAEEQAPDDEVVTRSRHPWTCGRGPATK